MNKKSSLAFRIVLFCLGLGIIGLASKLLWPVTNFVPARYVCFWISIVFAYLILFVPICFVSVKLDDIGRVAPLFVVAWKFIIPFEVACIILAFLVLFGSISIAWGIVILFALLLFIGVGFFLCLASSSNKKNTEAAEKQVLGLITQIRSSMDVLVLKTAALPEKNADEKKRIQDLDEAVNLMAPVSTIDAAKLEQEILMNVTQISSLCDSVIAGSDDKDFKKSLTVLENQIRERKLKNK